jgi:hypothetical protein
MKKILNTFAAIGAALSLLVGCATINSLTPAQVALIGTVITQVSDQGALYAIQKSPSSVTYFQLAVPVINNFANGTDLSTAAFEKALSKITGTNQLVNLATSAAVMAYDVACGQYISNQLTNSPAAKAWITAVGTGFQMALDESGNGLKFAKVITAPSFIKGDKVERAVIKARVKNAFKAGE